MYKGFEDEYDNTAPYNCDKSMLYPVLVVHEQSNKDGLLLLIRTGDSVKLLVGKCGSASGGTSKLRDDQPLHLRFESTS